MWRLRRLPLLAAGLLLVGANLGSGWREPAAAMAAGLALPVQPVTLSADATTPRACQDIAVDTPAAGVARHAWDAAGDQALTVRAAAAPGSDWDLVVLDRETGRELGGSASAGPRERVTVLLDRGRSVVVQACRRDGDDATLDVELSSEAIPPQLRADRGTPQLVEVAIPAGERDLHRLEALGLDVTHHAHGGVVDVVTTGTADRRTLTEAGFEFAVEDPDLPATVRRAARADARRAGDPRAQRAIPSGRTTYRTLADYGTDLKALVDAHPGLVRRVDLGASLEGREIEGVEIAEGVGAPTDGRPTLLITGLTHAREWPGGELAIEFATDLARSFGSDARVTALLRRVRVLVVPIANPDGFAVSRQAGAAMAAGDDRNPVLTIAEAANDAGAYKRKNCRAQTPETQSTACALRAPFGVDLNRAYSAYWGGDGSSSDATTQQYRGTAPMTEPEAQAIQRLQRSRQVMVYLSNHTYTEEGRILRQPGFAIPNDEVGDTTPDEPAMAALGDRMATATAGISELGYATLGNITGPADDYLYYAQGTYGYTPELAGSNFHTSYANAVVREYDGAGIARNGTTAQGGWRSAYLAAGEAAASEADHVVLRGTAPADATLRLRKDFSLPRSTDQDGDGTADVPLVLEDEFVDTTLQARADGTFEWHVNPSKRPYGPESERWTLTCAVGGQVRATRIFAAARGESPRFDLAECGPSAAPTPPAAPSGPAPAAPSTPASPPPSPSTLGRRLAAAGSLGLRRPALSARRTNRGRPVQVRVVVRGATLTDVVVRIARGRRTLLRGTAARLSRTRNVRVRRVARLTPGRASVVLTGRVNGRSVRLTRTLRITR